MIATVRHPVNWRSWIAAAFSLVLLTGVFLVVHRELKHFQLCDVLAYLHQIPAPALIAAALCTIGSYLLLGMYDFAGLRYVGFSARKYAVRPRRGCCLWRHRMCALTGNVKVTGWIHGAPSE